MSQRSRPCARSAGRCRPAGLVRLRDHARRPSRALVAGRPEVVGRRPGADGSRGPAACVVRAREVTGPASPVPPRGQAKDAEPVIGHRPAAGVPGSLARGVDDARERVEVVGAVVAPAVEEEGGCSGHSAAVGRLDVPLDPVRVDVATQLLVEAAHVQAEAGGIAATKAAAPPASPATMALTRPTTRIVRAAGARPAGVTAPRPAAVTSRNRSHWYASGASWCAPEASAPGQAITGSVLPVAAADRPAGAAPQPRIRGLNQPIKRVYPVRMNEPV